MIARRVASSMTRLLKSVDQYSRVDISTRIEQPYANPRRRSLAVSPRLVPEFSSIRQDDNPFWRVYVAWCTIGLRNLEYPFVEATSMPSPFPGMDPDLPLDLCELFETTYERGRYKRSLTYSVPTPAPLSAEDLQWAAALGTALPH
jgi:hypothetical protein